MLIGIVDTFPPNLINVASEGFQLCLRCVLLYHLVNLVQLVHVVVRHSYGFLIRVKNDLHPLNLRFLMALILDAQTHLPPVEQQGNAVIPVAPRPQCVPVCLPCLRLRRVHRSQYLGIASARKNAQL